MQKTSCKPIQDDPVSIFLIDECNSIERMDAYIRSITVESRLLPMRGTPMVLQELKCAFYKSLVELKQKYEDDIRATMLSLPD